MNKKLKFFLVPLILTLVGFAYNPECSTDYCMFAGNGFPFGYYDNGAFRIAGFVADYIFFFLVYSIPVLAAQDRKRWIVRHTPKKEATLIQDPEEVM
ncbi:MAG TPA: hypothetical protein VGE18_00830 [Candidatus Paceibacterota bacterium]